MKIKELIIVDSEASRPQRYSDIEIENGNFAGLKKAVGNTFEGKAVVLENKQSLIMPDAAIPNQDRVIVFVSTKNVKGGMFLADTIEEASHVDLKKMARKLRDVNEEIKECIGNYTTTPTEELRANIHDAVAIYNSKAGSPNTTDVEEVIEMCDKIEMAAIELRKAIEELPLGGNLEDMEDEKYMSIASKIKSFFTKN